MAPILFSIGPFNAYSFGFFLSLSFLLSTYIVWKYSRQIFKEEEYLDIFLYQCLVMLVFARGAYIITHFDEFGWNILRYIVVRETPGLSLLTGLVGGFVFLYWYARKKKKNFWQYADLFSLAVSFAMIFTKIGEQLGGAGFGKPTNSFIGVRIAGVTGLRHPVELYEAFIYLIVFLLLTVLFHRSKKMRWPEGIVALIFVVCNTLVIFLLEFLKEYSVYLYGLSYRQIVVLLVLLIFLYPLYSKIKQIRTIKKAKI